jgi:biopolymer transport protein ExbB
MQENAFSLLELFRMGGFFMFPLLFFSIAAVAIALERAIYLLYHNLRLEDLHEAVAGFLRAKDIAGSQEYLRTVSRRRMGARILLVLVGRPDLSEHQMEKAAEAEAMTCINALENGFHFLTVIGSLAPLTGFLGTVSGMIGAFKSIAEATEVNAQIVANGIYEALITTVFGLIIAIIAMIAHSLFTHIVDKFAAEVEKTCSDIITELALLQNVKPQERPGLQQNSDTAFTVPAKIIGSADAPQIISKPVQPDVFSLEKISSPKKEKTEEKDFFEKENSSSKKEKAEEVFSEKYSLEKEKAEEVSFEKYSLEKEKTEEVSFEKKNSEEKKYSEPEKTESERKAELSVMPKNSDTADFPQIILKPVHPAVFSLEEKKDFSEKEKTEDSLETENLTKTEEKESLEKEKIPEEKKAEPPVIAENSDNSEFPQVFRKPSGQSDIIPMEEYV